jgi:RNA polymerase sigma-70 factor (ECF subfamily)
VTADADLLARFLAGDPAAAEEVSGWVRQAAAAFRRRLAFEWDDVLQQALVELTADLRAERFRGEGAFRGYVWRSVNHTCLDRLRRHRRWRFEPVEELPLEAPAPSPYAVASTRQTSRRVLALLAAMPEHCRELWEMILDELSYRDMGERLGVAEGTLRVRVLRCRQQAVSRWRDVTESAPARREGRSAGEGATR